LIENGGDAKNLSSDHTRHGFSGIAFIVSQFHFMKRSELVLTNLREARAKFGHIMHSGDDKMQVKGRIACDCPVDRLHEAMVGAASGEGREPPHRTGATTR